MITHFIKNNLKEDVMFVCGIIFQEFAHDIDRNTSQDTHVTVKSTFAVEGSS